MNDPNDVALQIAFAKQLEQMGLPNPGENCVIQIQWQDTDLVVRCRFKSLSVAHHKVSGALSPVSEMRYNEAAKQSHPVLLAWIREVAVTDALVLARTEYEKRGFRWPNEFPHVPTLPELRRAQVLAGAG